MAWVTKDSVEQYDHTPEPPKEYTKKEKAQNWWHYHKFIVLGVVVAILSINYDVSALTMIRQTIDAMLSTHDQVQAEPERIINVNNVLDELVEQSVALVGKPVALMNKDDKIKAIRFLNESGAFLVTKSGDKVAKYFGISKYTLYSYIDANKK